MKRQPRVLIVDDDDLITEMIGRVLKAEGIDVRTLGSPEGVLAAVKRWRPSVVLLDVHFQERSGIDVLHEIVQEGLPASVVMLTADDTAETAVRAMKLGAADYVVKPFNIDEIVIIVQNLVIKEGLKREVSILRKELADRLHQEIVGDSAALRAVREDAERIARAHGSSILITGESGTGKDLLARHIHQVLFGEALSVAPFIAVNCAALPEHLLESELFGHEKGAFTDASTRKLGLFEVAHGGTIMLDEIGDMVPALQAKLLRVIEERVIRRLGGQEDIPVEVVVIATTNRDLAEAGIGYEFRRDLYFRLNTFRLHVPPLRARRDDIPLLAEYFLGLFRSRYNKRGIKGFSPEAAQLMRKYDWPGNIRELRNVVERIVVLEQVEEIGAPHLPEGIRSSRPAYDGCPVLLLPSEGLSLEDLERDLLKQALDRTHRNKAQAAKLLGLTYDAMRYQVKKFGFE